MNLLDALIAQGIKNNTEFTQELINIKKRVVNTPEKQSIKELNDVTAAMQNIDEFTLEQTMDLKSQISEIEKKLNGEDA